MRKSKTLPFFLGIVILFPLIIPLINNVNAVSYYNWLRNPSFESNINLIEDGGYESGLFNSGILYGNWSIEGGSPSFETGDVHSGVYCMAEGGTSSIKYTFSNEYDEFLIGEIQYFYVWVKCMSGSGLFDITVYYSDASYDSDSIAVGSTWQLVNFTDMAFMNEAKYMDYFILNGQSGDAWRWDDCVLTRNDINYEYQDEVALSTTPWSNLDFATAIFDWFELESDITTLEAYSGNQSYEFVEGSAMPIFQSIGYLDSDLVHFGDMMIKTEDTNGVKMSMIVLYTDSRLSQKNVTVSYNSGNWQHIQFSGFLYDNAYVEGIFLICYENTADSGLSTFIDDIGFWSSVSTDWKRFDWSLSPTPISKGINGFTAHQRTTYTLTINLYDENQTKTENGTYQLTDGSFGLKSGSFSSGTFSVVLNQRTIATTNDINDIIAILVYVGEEIIEINLDGSWQHISGDNVIPEEVDLDNYIALFIQLIVLIAPSFYVALKCAQNNFNPILGFLGTFNVMCIVGVSVNLVDFWILIVTVIIDVFLGLIALHQGGRI